MAALLSPYDDISNMSLFDDNIMLSSFADNPFPQGPVEGRAATQNSVPLWVVGSSDRHVLLTFTNPVIGQEARYHECTTFISARWCHAMGWSAGSATG